MQQKTIAAVLLAAICLGASQAWAEDKPAGENRAIPDNFLYDSSKEKKTIWPKPSAKDGGELKYEEHRQDLSKWVSLSDADKLATKQPETVKLEGELKGDPAKGKELAMNTQKGNCWACHALPGDDQPGSGGPNFTKFGSFGYDATHVYQQIWDRRVANPQTIMPPYGTNGVLNDQEIRDIAAFLLSIK